MTSKVGCGQLLIDKVILGRQTVFTHLEKKELCASVQTCADPCVVWKKDLYKYGIGNFSQNLKKKDFDRCKFWLYDRNTATTKL